MQYTHAMDRPGEYRPPGTRVGRVEQRGGGTVERDRPWSRYRRSPEAMGSSVEGLGQPPTTPPGDGNGAMNGSRRRRERPRLVMFALSMTLVLSACAGGDDVVGIVTPTPTNDLSQPVISLADGPCAGGRLTVGALAEMQAAWEQEIIGAQAAATAWQEDAKLVEAQVGCAFLGPGVEVKGRFYSGEARAYFASYTGVTTPIDPGVPEPPVLDTAPVSFERIAETLLAEGVDPTAEIHPTSGINVRYNGTSTPFGPPGTPAETIIIHVIVVTDGDARDLFIETTNWQTISFS